MECVCVCLFLRETEGQNVNMGEMQLAEAGQGFLPFLDPEYIWPLHILQKRYTKQMSVFQKPFVWNSGIVCDTKEWLNGILPNVYFSVNLHIVYLLNKTSKCCSGRFRFLKSINSRRLHQFAFDYFKTMEDIYGSFIASRYQSLKQVMKDIFHNNSQAKQFFAKWQRWPVSRVILGSVHTG